MRNGKKLSVTFTNGGKAEFNLDKLRKINEEYLDGNEHRLTLGVRGESISVSEKQIENSVPVTLSVKEVLGNVTQLFFKLDGEENDYVISVPGRSTFGEGGLLYISFSEKNIHLFDAETEQSVMGRQTGNK